MHWVLKETKMKGQTWKSSWVHQIFIKCQMEWSRWILSGFRVEKADRKAFWKREDFTQSRRPIVFGWVSREGQHIFGSESIRKGHESGKSWLCPGEPWGDLLTGIEELWEIESEEWTRLWSTLNNQLRRKMFSPLCTARRESWRVFKSYCAAIIIIYFCIGHLQLEWYPWNKEGYLCFGNTQITKSYIILYNKRIVCK